MYLTFCSLILFLGIPILFKTISKTKFSLLLLDLVSLSWFIFWKPSGYKPKCNITLQAALDSREHLDKNSIAQRRQDHLWRALGLLPSKYIIWGSAQTGEGRKTTFLTWASGIYLPLLDAQRFLTLLWYSRVWTVTGKAMLLERIWQYSQGPSEAYMERIYTVTQDVRV